MPGRPSRRWLVPRHHEAVALEVRKEHAVDAGSVDPAEPEAREGAREAVAVPRLLGEQQEDRRVKEVARRCQDELGFGRGQDMGAPATRGSRSGRRTDSRLGLCPRRGRPVRCHSVVTFSIS